LKILSWNCNGAMRKKLDLVDSFKADIIVIQECEDPTRSTDEIYKKWAGDNYFWIGENKNKGLGLFAKSEYQLKKLEWKAPKLRYFISCSVNDSFNIIGLWCHLDVKSNFHYIGQFSKYMKLHKTKFKTAILAGDFNSNVFWDKKNRKWNHSFVVSELQEIGIESLYHRYKMEEQGKETEATFYLTKKIDKPYHLDYIFASKIYSDSMKKIEIGKADFWMKHSDHMPVFCEIDMD
jgi:exonuclease III